MSPRPVPECEFQPLAVGLGLDALEPADEHELRRHLPSCTPCQHTVEQTQELMARIVMDCADIPAPASLWESIAAGLPPGALDRRAPDRIASRAPARRSSDVPVRGSAGSTPAPDAEPPTTGGAVPLPRRSSRWMLATAAALAAVLGLAGWNVVLQQQSNRASTVADQRASVLRLLERDDSRAVRLESVDGSGRGTMVIADDRAWLVLDSVPKNPSDSIFVLWGVRGSSTIPVATFDVHQSGLDVVELGAIPRALEGVDAVAISLEKGRVAPSSPSNRVATGRLA